MSYASNEQIYVDLEGISKQAEIIRDCHAVSAFPGRIQPPPYIGNDCLAIGRTGILPPVEVYEALLNLQRRVGDIARDYAAFHDLPPR